MHRPYRENIKYFSITDFLCKKEILPYSCLVGFKDKNGTLNLTSFDKAHLTYETTQYLKNNILKSLIN